MNWIIGIIGLMIGFALGVSILKRWLKDRTQEELITDKALHWRYGAFVWMVAGISAWAALKIYHAYF